MMKSPAWFIYCERIAIAAWTEHERQQEGGGKAKGNITTTLGVLEGVMRRLLDGKALTEKQKATILKWIGPQWYLGKGVSKAALGWTGDIRLSDRQVRLAVDEVRQQGLDPQDYRLDVTAIDAIRQYRDRASNVTSMSEECQVIVTSMSGECHRNVRGMSPQCHEERLQGTEIGFNEQIFDQKVTGFDGKTASGASFPKTLFPLYKRRRDKNKEEQTSGLVTSSPAQPLASPTLAAVPLASPSVRSGDMASPSGWGHEVMPVISGEMASALPSASGGDGRSMVARFARRRQSESELEGELARDVRRGAEPDRSIDFDAHPPSSSKPAPSHPAFDRDPNLRAMKAEQANTTDCQPSPGWHGGIGNLRVALWLGDDVRGVVTIDGQDRNVVLTTWDSFADKMCRHFSTVEDRAWRHVLDAEYGHVYRREMVATMAGQRPIDLFHAWSPLYEKDDRDGNRGPCETRMGLWIVWDGEAPTTAYLFNGLDRIAVDLVPSASSNARAPQYVGERRTATVRSTRAMAAA